MKHHKRYILRLCASWHGLNGGHVSRNKDVNRCDRQSLRLHQSPRVSRRQPNENSSLDRPSIVLIVVVVVMSNWDSYGHRNESGRQDPWASMSVSPGPGNKPSIAYTSSMASPATQSAGVRFINDLHLKAKKYRGPTTST